MLIFIESCLFDSNHFKRFCEISFQSFFPCLFFFCYTRKQGDGLFLKTCEEVSKLYPKIKFEGMIVDNTCMQVCKK